ncbi:hypothetical protein L5515_008657 [Caenorhabditis briggsae]|uniref:Uncharacterized protein n=1 Tax=Caenorhabditis briggsae TaxID=6238 RepID=A0AAE9F810_CAEBR|nr:hypothetical protein L5515_008657 [Caenorhabditis briggsae]
MGYGKNDNNRDWNHMGVDWKVMTTIRIQLARVGTTTKMVIGRQQLAHSRGRQKQQYSELSEKRMADEVDPAKHGTTKL